MRSAIFPHVFLACPLCVLVSALCLRAQVLQNNKLFGAVLRHIMKLGGTRKLFDTRKSSRTWIVQLF